MADKYRGIPDDRRYSGESVDVTYNLKRCIHARECVNRLSAVFDVAKRPWINADGAEADELATVIDLCPSGALHYERKDGGTAEQTPESNRIILWHDGPLQFHGDLSLQGATVDIAQETRATLCRCGASANKPFCDNSHDKINFASSEFEVKARPDLDADGSGKLSITSTENGPLAIEGNFRIEDTEGQVLYTGSGTWLCRCGHSKRKPFCDGTHNEMGFIAE